MMRVFRLLNIRRKPDATSAARTLSQLAAADREARHLTYRQAVRARALEMARSMGRDDLASKFNG